MDKLAWVLLPLMLAVGVVGVWAWRRRMPSRLALNVWSSVLLMAYVLTTAGLGIFWVANQHLPVFDWHYLFGYATVLLLAVHLAFNFRVVWRHLTQHRPAAAAAAGAAPVGATTPRRRAAGALGLLGAVAVGGGGAFWLGVRQGRTEIHVSPGPAAGGPAGGQAMAVVEQFHEFSAHSRAGVFRRAAGTQWAARPPPFKAYPGALQVVLPSANGLRPTRADAPGMPLDIDLVARVLWCSAGVNKLSADIHFRTAPSSGALFATELYLCARRVAGLTPGWWHYDGRAHRLNRVAELESAEPGAAAELVATAIFARSGHKYRDRTYRYVLGDLGHLLENARATAAALGSLLVPQRLFDESLLARQLGLDEVQEGVLAWLWFDEAAAGATAVAGTASVVGAASPPATTALREPSARPGPWAAPKLAQASQTQALGVTDAVHRATSLRAWDGPQSAPSPVQPAVPSQTALQLPPPSPVVRPAEVQALIARRRSVRRFSEQALPLAALGTVLHHMARGHTPLFSDAVRLDLVTHAVQGLPSTAWRYDAARHALLRRREETLARQAAHRAALDQDVIGDAAVVFVLSMARAALAHDEGGPARGYRHAFIESGLVGERLYLAANALGLGVCAVGAFYDDEAARLVAVDPAHEWVVHFAALGVPS